MNGLTMKNNSWQKQLIDAMGFLVEEVHEEMVEVNTTFSPNLMIQRTKSRIITNFAEIKNTLQLSLPDAYITETTFDMPLMKDQAEWFATKDIIIAAHGAALANSVFITPGTIILQIYPRNYFSQSLDPLIEQSGGIALDWYNGKNPFCEWVESKARGEQNVMRDASIAPSVDEIVDTILKALGKKVATN